MLVKRRLSPFRLCSLLVLVALALAATACGSDDDEDTPARESAKQDLRVEKAFLTGMVHHHETAIEMAKIAEERGQDRFVKRLAAAIAGTQEREIAQMRSIHTRLLESTLKPDPRAHDGLGLTAEEAGMTHDADTNQALREADPFDRAFVDEMVPHHHGAVAMARVVLKDTKDAELRTLAETIIRTQEREIEEMNDFRERKFGAPVPESRGHESETSTEEHGTGH